MIPDFDIHGIVPPVRPGAGDHSAERAPYPVDFFTFARYFGFSPSRRAILGGLLNLRAEFHALGLTEGYQWIDGSFLEHVERLANRSPNDVDVVTFAVLGDSTAQRSLRAKAPHLIDPEACKQRYSVDHYVIPSDRHLDEPFARRISYWYSLWSRQRGTRRWKGFVSVPLLSNDEEARRWLASDLSGGRP